MSTKMIQDNPPKQHTSVRYKTESSTPIKPIKKRDFADDIPEACGREGQQERQAKSVQKLVSVCEQSVVYGTFATLKADLSQPRRMRTREPLATSGSCNYDVSTVATVMARAPGLRENAVSSAAVSCAHSSRYGTLLRRRKRA